MTLAKVPKPIEDSMESVDKDTLDSVTVWDLNTRKGRCCLSLCAEDDDAKTHKKYRADFAWKTQKSQIYILVK